LYFRLQCGHMFGAALVHSIISAVSKYLFNSCNIGILFRF